MSKKTHKSNEIYIQRPVAETAFSDSLNALTESWSTQKKQYVLNYYGIAGIGKTSLVNYLQDNSGYLIIDFDKLGLQHDKLHILKHLRDYLKKNTNFTFERFDYAIECYNKQTKQNSWMSVSGSAVDIATAILTFITITDIPSGLLPAFGCIGAVLKLGHGVNKLLAKTHNAKKEDWKSEIAFLSPDELVNHLHEFFIADMQINMQDTKKAEQPLILFCDTCEKYIGAIEFANIDSWFYQTEDSVLASIPGILWVIAGREKLKDINESNSKLPSAQINRLQLCELTLEETRKYLENSGVTDTTLQKDLYDLTNGTPLYLCLCAETYNQLAKKKRNITIDQFGKDISELTLRYLDNIHDTSKKVAVFLACLGNWTDESKNIVLKQLKSKIPFPEYNDNKYITLIKHSFIIAEADGSYSMQSTVRDVLTDYADQHYKEFKSAILHSKSAFLEEELKKAPDNFSALFYEYIQALTSGVFSYDEFLSRLQFIRECLVYLQRLGLYDNLLSAGKRLYNYTSKYHAKTVADTLIRIEYGSILCYSDREEAKKVISDINSEELRRLKNDTSQTDNLSDAEYYTTTARLANILGNEDSEKTLELRKEVLDYCIGELKTAFETNQRAEDQLNNVLSALNNYADSCLQVGDIETAIKFEEIVLNIRENLYEKTSESALRARTNLSIYLLEANKQKANPDLADRAINLRQLISKYRLENYNANKTEENANLYLYALDILAAAYSDIKESSNALHYKILTYFESKKMLGADDFRTKKRLNDFKENLNLPDTVKSLSPEDFELFLKSLLKTSQ